MLAGFLAIAIAKLNADLSIAVHSLRSFGVATKFTYARRMLHWSVSGLRSIQLIAGSTFPTTRWSSISPMPRNVIDTQLGSWLVSKLLVTSMSGTMLHIFCSGLGAPVSAAVA